MGSLVRPYIEVCYHDVKAIDIRNRQSGSSIFDDLHLVTRARKNVVECRRQIVVIVDYQYPSLHRGRGGEGLFALRAGRRRCCK
jgi:hypothetical protein